MSTWSVHVYDDRFCGVCHVRPDGPVVARAFLREVTGHLWWRQQKFTEGFAVVQSVFLPDTYGGDDYFRPVKFFETQEEAMAFAKDIAVVVSSAKEE